MGGRGAYSDKLYQKRKVETAKRSKLKTKRFEPETFLIVTEGKKTEPNYFKSFPLKKRSDGQNILNLIIIGEGDNTLSLVEKAIEYASRIESGQPLSQKWVVFDKDSFPKDNFDNAIKKAEYNGFNVAISNESFELWYLLHFIPIDTALHREQYIESLNVQYRKNGIFTEYKKNDIETYNIINTYGNEEKAIIRAKRLINLHGHYIIYSSANPITTVYKLVEQLNKYKINN